ncbi:MAG: M28 family peptidase [Planctomycetes bacterium]|nr:M28 family peptidase [Planctomycetota bacterium]
MTSTELATNISGPMQFCGLSRTPGPNPDVAVGANLTGKIAIAVVPTKGDAAPNLTAEQRFGISFQTYRQLGKVATALSEKGAAAVVFVQVRDATGLTDCLSTLLPSTQQPRISLPMPVARQRASSPARAAPAIVLSPQASKVVLEALHLTEQELDEHLDDGTGVAARTDVPATLDLAVTIRTDAKACNVVAVLRGSDPKLAHQAVIYTAHVDHIGARMDGAAYNGANDNASGVAGLIGVARMFAAGPRPRRSIVFLVTAGEELGLWGSQFFVDNPAWPIENIVANINFEMIGRTGRCTATEFVATPSYRHSRFSSLGHDAAQIAAGLGITLLPGDEYYRQSDHFPFAERGIPALSIGDGNFVDYHLVTDDAGAIDGRRVHAAMRAAAELGRRVAMDEEAPSTRQAQAGW